MNQKNLYIVRHGQTDFNKKGMVQGRGIDADLNEEGRSQAAMFFQKYQDHNFDKIYISELKRTEQSVDGFIEKGIPFEKLSGLDEISWGSQEGKPFSDEAAKLYKATIHKWTSGELDVAVSDGETPLQVQRRQEKAIDYITSQKDEKEVLICMHGRAIRILLTWLVGKDLSQMETIPHTNLCLYVVAYDGEKFEVIVENDTSHLL